MGENDNGKPTVRKINPVEGDSSLLVAEESRRTLHWTCLTVRSFNGYLAFVISRIFALEKE